MVNAVAMSFPETLEQHGLKLQRSATTTLQVNVGLACDLACRHCHLEAGPQRTELMSADTVETVIYCARRLPFQAVDITGGAPEFLPHLPRLISGIAPLAPRVMVRTNLTALARPEHRHLMELYRSRRVVIVASLPATNPGQTESQRGSGVWQRCIDVLRQLNDLGYGKDGTGLELDLVSNPTGAFLPVEQQQAERKFRHDLERRYGIAFTSLYTFANAPLGRFRNWLQGSGNLEGYLDKLQGAFNPCTLEGVMCRSLISVGWDGTLYDCDFNLAAGLHHGGQPLHISRLLELPAEGTPIPMGDHCYACTAGSGFT